MAALPQSRCRSLIIAGTITLIAARCRAEPTVKKIEVTMTDPAYTADGKRCPLEGPSPAKMIDGPMAATIRSTSGVVYAGPAANMILSYIGGSFFVEIRPLLQPTTGKALAQQFNHDFPATAKADGTRKFLEDLAKYGPPGEFAPIRHFNFETDDHTVQLSARLQGGVSDQGQRGWIMVYEILPEPSKPPTSKP